LENSWSRCSRGLKSHLFYLWHCIFIILYHKFTELKLKLNCFCDMMLKQVDYISWVCDQDAYACSGQKCSAQSMLFMHKVKTKKRDHNSQLLVVGLSMIYGPCADIFSTSKLMNTRFKSSCLLSYPFLLFKYNK
jgi:hypothetical protein